MRSRPSDSADIGVSHHPPSGFGVRPQELTRLVAPNTLRAAKEPEERILTALRNNGFRDEIIFGVKLALEEALTNAVKHGNRGDASKHITVSYAVTPERAVIMVADEGPGFAPDCVPDPTLDENLERPCGRGLMLMRAYMTRVEYSETGNCVWMLRENR
ncbi:MAG: ATP-binding protein [Phycisphaerales bacterium]|nr:ATP-binding protein [Phycisphaerales bacterium]